MQETDTLQEVTKVLTLCLQTIQKSEERIDRVNAMIDKLSTATHDQTETFVMQINKLSKRIDAAEEDRRSLIKLNEDQGKRIDNLISLLHDAITKQTNFIQQQ